MAETVETLTERLDHVEKGLEEIRQQLSRLVDELVPASPKNRGTTAVQRAFHGQDKQREAQAIQKMREYLGIADIELMPLEELHESLKRQGIRPEDNEFSRAILKEREK